MMARLTCSAAFIGHPGQDYQTGLSLHQRHNGLFVAGSDHRVAFPVTDTDSGINNCRTLCNRPSANDLAAPIATRPVALATPSLASKPAPDRATHGPILVDMPIQGLMTDCQLGSHLLGTPLQAHQIKNLLQCLWRNCLGIARTLASRISKLTGLPGAISPKSGITVNLTAHRGLMPTKDGSNLGLVLSGFHQYCNLIPFMMAEVLIGQRETSTWRLKWPRILKHPRLPQLP